ncbi:G protein-coupled receptor [Trichostrongylus colubriformis]|uniref:G protein-coupled receptor n=1 Tax=Trichostrongylus colubriformis TaxID=6319 RepID=A0AAN8EXC6_TRICO
MMTLFIYLMLVVAGVSQARDLRTFDQQVTDALNALVPLDARLDQYTVLNYQNMASSKNFSHDNAKQPLFTSVDNQAISGATYKAYNNLISFYNQPDVDIPEVVTTDWESTIDTFLDAVMSTAVMQSTQQFLTKQGTISDGVSFKALLHSLWFTQYARNAAVGSSGFESVFSGEIEGGDVIRFNNWFRFYEQETTGQVNYHGWFTKEAGVLLSLQFSWREWKAMQTAMLLNTSPEFEMAVYTICALNGGQCEMTINNQPVTIFASTLKEDGVTVIDQCYPGVSGSSPTKKPSATTKKSSASDPDLQTLVDNMRAADVDKAGPNDYILNWGNKASGNTKTSPNQLFTYVNESLFQRPVYATLIDVFNKNLFTPEVCTAEQAMTGFRKATLQQVFDTWTATDVFNLAFQYLQKKKYSHATDMATLKAFLWNLWFGTYSRCNGAIGSSGWEHVFVGEWKGTTIDGQHDWTRYYLLQKADHINYHGYYSYVVNLTGTFQYTWENELKPKGGFLIGTSPAFDFSLLTVCALIHPGNDGCKYSIDGHPLGVTSYTQECAAGTCLSTAYPVN